MKDYVIFYRNDPKAMPEASAEQAAAMMQRWMDWMRDMQDKGQLVSQGNRLDFSSGRVIKPDNVITNGPYAEIKEAIGGYSIIKAASYDEAVEIAKGCPVLNAGGNVEIREINVM